MHFNQIKEISNVRIDYLLFKSLLDGQGKTWTFSEDVRGEKLLIESVLKVITGRY